VTRSEPADHGDRLRPPVERVSSGADGLHELVERVERGQVRVVHGEVAQAHVRIRPQTVGVFGEHETAVLALGEDAQSLRMVGAPAVPLLALLRPLGETARRTVAAAAARIRSRDCSGVLMNSLDIGLRLHIIDGRVFTILVLMALVTTIATAPGLRRFVRTPAKSVKGTSDGLRTDH
jgi:hypothetical protein